MQTPASPAKHKARPPRLPARLPARDSVVLDRLVEIIFEYGFRLRREPALNLQRINMLTRDPVQLDSTAQRHDGKTNPRGGAAAKTIYDADKRRREGARKTARRHGEPIHATKDRRRGRRVLEEYKRAWQN